MNFDFGAITGAIMQLFGGMLGIFNVSTEAGNGLLGFVEFFGMFANFFNSVFTKLISFFSGLAG